MKTDTNPTKTPPLKYLGISVTIALVYLVFGKLALLLAIPPGYASVVWPAAGVALGALLIFGDKYWPSIFIGSAMTNMMINFDASTTLAIIKSLMIGSAIGIGATLQAAAGSKLIKKHITYPNALYQPKDILIFTFTAAVISSLVNTTFSNLILWLAQVITLPEVPKSWIIWWIGDAIGILIFTPIMLILFGEPKKLWRSRSFLLIPTMIMFVFYVLFFHYYLNTQITNAKRKFKNTTWQIGSELNNKINVANNTLHAIQHLFYASQHVSRKEFKNFVTDALKENLSIQALSWSPIITKKDKQRYIQWAKQDGYKNFTINQINNGTIIKDINRDAYYVIYYIEPEIGNQAALGLNLGSNPIRMSAIQRLLSTRKPQATKPLKLAQETGTQYSVILFYPLEKPNYPGSVANKRDDKIHGILSGVYRIKTMMNTFLLSNELKEIKNLYLDKEIIIQLCDNTADSGKILLYTNQYLPEGTSNTEELIKQLSWSRTYNFGNRKWILTVSPTKHYMTNLLPSGIWIVLTLAMLFIGIINLFLLLISGQRISVNKLASKRTRRLKNILIERQKILNSMNIAIIKTDLNGAVTFANRKALQLTGFTKKELIGKDLHEMTHYQHENGKTFPKNLCTIHSSLHISQSVQNELDQIITKNKKFIQVNISKRPIVDNDKLLGAVIYFERIKPLK